LSVEKHPVFWPLLPTPLLERLSMQCHRDPSRRIHQFTIHMRTCYNRDQTDSSVASCPCTSYTYHSAHSRCTSSSSHKRSHTPAVVSQDYGASSSYPPLLTCWTLLTSSDNPFDYRPSSCPVPPWYAASLWCPCGYNFGNQRLQSTSRQKMWGHSDVVKIHNTI
jgi:hypothetical protein